MTMNTMKYKFLVLLLLAGWGSSSVWAQSEETLPTDVTGYETVTVSIPATDYNADAGAPQMAPVKYNRQCALVITSDDMGTGEYLNNWALMNGYPLYGDWRLGNDGKVNWGICPRGEDALNAPYNTTYMGARSQNVNDYQPLTFTDDAGKEHRFTATSAIWPASYNDNNYAHMQGDEAQIMVRTGWSFAQHDVNNITGDTDAEKIASIASRFQPLSELWENNVTGIGLKVMVEPNGDKNYIDATAASNEMCWSIFQSADATHPAISNNVSTWTTSLPTTFSDKSNGSTARTFPNADATKEQNFLTQTESAIASGSTDPIFYGCHGMGTYPRQLVTDIATNATYKDKVWVTSADEYWEYYNIYKNATIGTPTWDDTNKQLTFTVQVPKYNKNQFRELTINIPGLTGGTDCTLTSSDGTVTTGSYAQTNDASKGYVVNFGMETKILGYIDELTALYRNNPSNLFVKRDAQYLIDQLLPGATKTAKQNALDKEYDYSYLATANLQENGATVATKTLSSGYYDAATDVKYYIPRYILEGTTLYKTTGNGAMTQSNNTISQPWYGNYLSVNTANISAPYTYEKEKENVVFYTEAEDISGHGGVVPDHTTNWDSFQGRVEALCSAGSGVRRDGNNFGTITTLEPGTYKVTIGVVASASNDGGYYSIRVGGTDAANEVGNYAGATKDQLTEYTTDEFTVKENKTVNVYHSGSSNVALDYVFIQKTADFEPSDPTVTFSSNVSAAQVNSTVTLKATPVWNGKGALTSLKFQYKTTGGADSEFTDIATVTDPVSDTEYTQTFTPTSIATYIFRAVLTDADATVVKTTDDAATAASAGAVAISVQESVPYDGDYTLHLIDNAGNEVFTQTVTHATVSGGNTDPLADQYRSPFVSTYLYFDSQAEAQANTGTPSFWNQQDIYVGYTVDATKMGEGKVHAIWGNSRYIHLVEHVKNGTFQLTQLKYDAVDAQSTPQTSDITVSNQGVLDNSYMWDLGSDPYNVQLKSKAIGQYASTRYNNSPNLVTSSASANKYCILYWQGNTATSTVETSAEYYLVYDRTTSTSATLAYDDNNNHYLAISTDNEMQCRSVDKKHGSYDTVTKVYIQQLPTVTINILNGNKQVESQLQGYYKTDATSIKNSSTSGSQHTPHFLYRAFTSNHHWFYKNDATDEVDYTAAISTSKLADNRYNLYVTYDLDATRWGTLTTTANTTNIMPFTENDATINWYAMRSANNDNYALLGDNGTLTQIVNTSKLSDITADPSTESSKRGQWAFIGTPYNVQIVNRYYGSNAYLGMADDAENADRFSVYKYGTAGAITNFEVLTRYQASDKLFFRPQAAFNGKPYLYLGYDSGNSRIGLNNTAGANQAFDFTYVTEAAMIHPSTVHLTATTTSLNIDNTTTLTATATPDNVETNNVSYLVIEQETGTDVWTPVGTAYDENVSSTASMKDANKVVTVTYAFTPSEAGTYNFRARAVIDNATQLSTDEAANGGDGRAVVVTASVPEITVGSDNYTLILVDKSGNELFTESNVPKSRVVTPNDVSGRNADPIDDSWRSPLVTRYYYYSTKADAQTNSGSNLFDWSSTAATPTVYVGYEVSDAIDLNSTHFSSLSDLMNTRVARSATEATLVRDAGSFGKMYLLKFKTGAVYHSEDGSDKVEMDETPAGTNVYPYTNGDGPMYIYTDSRYQDQKDNGASTRTRWPWFLVSPTGDPYHVYITSWQNSHANSGTNYYSYLRTFYQSGVGIVTNNVTDDPRTRLYNATTNPNGSTAEEGGSDDNVPTEYMLLRADDSNGTYKLTTVAAIDNGTTTERRTVTSLEQYWRNNPTAQIQAGRSESNNGELTDAEKTTLRSKGWNNYNAWVNAAGWTGGTGSGNKSYANSEHWYQSIQLGNGSFDLVEANIDGVLVLLDNHGWEIMRQPIVEKDDPDYESVKAALRKYDSPMVSQYKFYSTRNVNHKVYGYHKYDIITNTGSKTPLAASTRVDADKTITSLADYPEVTSGGALTDLYVTYDVKDEYVNSYVGAATEAGTSASSFLLRQGSNYAKANGSSITTTTDAAAADNWYLKPNFNIDAEMGYQYDNGTGNSEPSKDALETIYYNAGWNGFDPYNLRIQNVSTSTYFTTNADEAALSSGAWTGNGTTLSLTDATSTYGATGYDQTTLAVTNATFMAVQDGNGNMRLMPRFQHEKVMQGFTALAEQADDQPAGNTTHAQTTLLSTPVTYHIIDNSGVDVFGALTYTGAGFAVPKEYQSPMVEQYYYHSSLSDAQDNRTTSNVTTVSPNDVVYVSYKVSDDFNADKAYTIYGAISYMHACYRYGIAEDNSSNGNYLWWMQNQKVDRDNGNDISLTTLPFLDNTYAWQVGATPDPYNVRFLNKGAHRYLNQSTTGNDNRMEQLAIIETAGEVPATATPFCILYYGDDTDDCTLYNRTYEKYVYDNNGDWRANTSRTGDNRRLTITELPAISINVVNAANEVECTLEGFFKSGCTWSNSFTPFYLQRIYTSGHTFYYTLADAAAGTNAISGTVDDATVTANSAVYVKYTLSSDWGAAVDNDDLAAKKAAQTIKVLPSPDNNNKINWYALRTNNAKYLGFTSATGNLGDVSQTNATSDVDKDANKLAQWALMGTPYKLQLVDRYHGTSNYLAVSEDAKAGDFAFISDGTADITTWEVCTGYSSNAKLLIRPQRSLNGETPYLYIGWNGGAGNMSLTMSTGGNQGLDLTWLKETDAKHVTFKLYDRNGNYMAETANGGIADVKIDGVSIGDDLSALFDHTNMQRRYCEYTFYSDAEMTNAETKASDNLNETVYVKWDYTADAPVFSQPGWDKRDYQYYMLGVWGFNNYNLMDVEGEGTTDSPYTFKPNSDVGTPRDLKHQFAIVGNPYGFKLYNRAADRDIKRNKDLEITFADKEADGTTPTEEITFDLPIVSGSAYTSTETHFRSTKTGRYLSVTGTNENKLFSMTDNARGYTRFRYIIVPVRVFKEGAVSSTAEKDYRMYALEMNPSGTARATDARITTNDLRATGNAIGNARDFNHAFCNYTYYQKYDWNTSVSAPVPDDGLSYYGGKDQNKRQFIATYTVDQDAFDRLYYLDNSPHHDNAYSSKGAESTSNAGSYTTLHHSDLSTVKADTKDIYRWKFTGDPYDLQIHNMSMGEFADNYALAVKVPTETGATAPTEAAGTLVLLTDDLKTDDSDTESYGQYSHWEIIQRSDGHYLFWNIETPERYTYSLTSQADKLNKNNLYMTVPPFENGSTTVLNINQVEWNLVDVFNHYDVTWHVMEKNGESSYTEVATDTKVVDENVVVTIEDLPASVKRHFCDYEKMYIDAACTTEITEHTVNAATDIYVPYTLDSGAPEFVTEAPTGTPTGTESYWYEIHFPNAGSYLYADGTGINKDSHDIGIIRTNGSTTSYPHYRWALIGSPYDVKFYNMETKNFMTNDGKALSMGSTGTSFDLLDNTVDDEDIEGLGTIFDTATSTYITGNAGLQAYQSGYTACEFSNVNGVVHIVFRLHYSDKTLRKYDSDNDGDLSDEPEGNAVNTLGNIDITTFQKLGKDLNEIFPQSWKRTFCNYTYYWKTGTGENSTISEIETTQTEVTQEMINAFNNDSNHQPIYVHVTYDFEGGQNPKWSTADKKYTGKHWYYLVNNHRPNGEQGKMVYRDVSPKLRVSTSLQQNRLYLNNFEWCVIGDPYGFKMLNRYDPDHRFDEYIRVTDSQDSHRDGLQLEQSGTDSQNIFEMMPGQHSYNFWIHPIYNQDVMDEYTSEMSYVGNNYNGSAAIIPNDQQTMAYLKTNSSANFRLEIQSDATLAEYVKYAGFVGGLKYDKVMDAMREDAADGELSDEEKTAIRALIDDPENIVQMKQGYYRIVPYMQEDGTGVHKYLRGYQKETELSGSENHCLKVETKELAEYDPASIFWFEGTKEDETDYPRYYVRTQGLSMSASNAGFLSSDSEYKCRYEDLGASITQLKVASNNGDLQHNYLSCTNNATTSATDQCFDEQAGQLKTRFYLQPVGIGGNEMPFKMKMNVGDLRDAGDAKLAKLRYTYTSLYVPYDLLLPENCDAEAFIGKTEHYHPAFVATEDNYYNKDEYSLYLHSVDLHQTKQDANENDISARFIPAGTPVVFRSVSGVTDIEFTLPSDAPSEAISGNTLSGTYLKTANSSAQIRIFGRESDENGRTGRVGFFPRQLEDTPLTNNKVYYMQEDHSSESSRKGIFFEFTDDATVGIANVGGRSDDKVYDLQGRRLDPERVQRTGVYIVNGRKVVLRK